jgi:choline dehydrogenase-like flavoprotein
MPRGRPWRSASTTDTGYLTTIPGSMPPTAASPAIWPNYLGDELDRRTLVASMKIARRIVNNKALDRYRAFEMNPGDRCQTDDELLGFARQFPASVSRASRSFAADLSVRMRGTAILTERKSEAPRKHGARSAPRQQAERQLAAVVAADIAGCPCLMGAYEEGTLGLMLHCRREVRSGLAAGGRWIRTIGPRAMDGILSSLAMSSASRSLGSPAAVGRQSAAGWSVLVDGMA